MSMIPVTSDPESLTMPTLELSDETSPTMDLLADHRRRTILRYLEESESPVSLSDIADQVLLEEQADERGLLARFGDAVLGTRRRVYASLRYVHVPKLAAADAVDFDPDSNTVSLRGMGTGLLTRLDLIDEGVEGAQEMDQGTTVPTPHGNPKTGF